MEKVSVCLTVYNEEKGIKRVLSYLENNSHLFDDLIIISDACVDKTNEIITDWMDGLTNQDFYVKFHDRKDRKGRADAIRLGLKESKHDIMVIFSGDIKPLSYSFCNLIGYFDDGKVGAVTGHPILLNSERTPADCLSYIMWESHDNVGRIETKKGSFFHLNGEMFAIRKAALFGFHDYDGLVEDAMIGWLIYKNGYRVLWAENVEYYMKYPSSLKEWLKIRKRCCFGRVELAKKGNIKRYPFYELDHVDYLINIFNVSRKSIKRFVALPLGMFIEILCRFYYHFQYNKMPSRGLNSDMLLTSLWQSAKETKW